MRILFEKGLLGLEKYKEFILTEIEEAKPYMILQSVEDKNVGLVLISPFEIYEDYEIELDKGTIKDIKISSQNDIMLYTTVNINNATTNLRAPIVINLKEQLGKQIILSNEEYKIKHPISMR